MTTYRNCLITCLLAAAFGLIGLSSHGAPSLVSGYRLERFVPLTWGPDLYGATSIAYDPYDELFYLADSFNGQVWQIDAARDITLLTDQLDVPKDIAVDPITGEVYVADFYRGEIAIVGSEVRLVTGLGLASAVATSMVGDYVGEVYLADADSGTVYLVNFTEQKLDTVATDFSLPNDLVYDHVYDVLYVVDTDAGAVYLVNPSLGVGFNTFMVTDNLDTPLFADFGFDNDLLVTLASGEIVSIDLTAWIVGQRAPVYPFGMGFTDVQGLISLPISDGLLPDTIFVVDRGEGIVYRITVGTEPPDSDEDGISDDDEIQIYGTDPYSADTDRDGLFDDEELATYMTDPVLPDSDYDGLTDGLEAVLTGTDPLEADTDDDEYNDGWEYYVPTDPLDAADRPSLRSDIDNDFLRGDLETLAYGTDPFDADTDGDGVADWAELAIGSDPLDGAVANTDPRFDDLDMDGLNGNTELLTGTDPAVSDSDGDGVPDGAEVVFMGTDPLDSLSVELDDDPDGDGLSTSDENVAGTDPKQSDSDGDGIVDSAEAYGDLDTDGLFGFEENVFGSDPDNPDSDGDGILDVDEALVDVDGDSLVLIDEIQMGTSDDNPDTDGDGDSDFDEALFDLDGDGLTGYEEIVIHGTDPDEFDTDGDGFPDGQEIAIGTDPVIDADTPADRLDLDGDMLTGLQETGAGTDPTDPDTDDDGYADGIELIAGSDPNNGAITNVDVGDSDGDGLTDAEELRYGTQSDLFDTDSDGYGDGAEIALFATDPLAAESTPADMLDLDGDGLNGAQETRFGTDPLDPDTNEDGVIDGLEAVLDLDGDGLTGFEEHLLGTDIYLFDTDGDGVSDFGQAASDPDDDGIPTLDELGFGTDPALADTDSDGTDDDEVYYGDLDGDAIPGFFEHLVGTDLAGADTDGDGSPDGEELSAGSDPLRADDVPGGIDSAFQDDDGDGLPLVIETAVGTDPSVPDTDGDGVSDGAEVRVERTNPLVVDTDGDGYTDGDEVALNTDPTNPIDPVPAVTPGPPHLARAVLRPAAGSVFVGMEIDFSVETWFTDGSSVSPENLTVTYSLFGVGTLDAGTGKYTATRQGRSVVSAFVEYEGVHRAATSVFIVRPGRATLSVGSAEADPGDSITLSVTFATSVYSGSAVELDLHYDPNLIEVQGVTPAPALTEAGKSITLLDGSGSDTLRLRVSGSTPALIPSGKLCDLDISVASDAPDVMAVIEVGSVTALARAARASYWLGTSTQDGRILIESGEPVRGTPDIDGDGSVNAIDVQRTINQALGLMRSVGDALADIDEDGKIDAVDVQLVINAALGIS